MKIVVNPEYICRCLKHNRFAVIAVCGGFWGILQLIFLALYRLGYAELHPAHIVIQILGGGVLGFLICIAVVIYNDNKKIK